MTRTPNNDEPDIDISLLPERRNLLIKLVDDIRECNPPMVFGVHGDWGAGKTSFVQTAMYALTGCCPGQEKLRAEDEMPKDKATDWQTKLNKWQKEPPLAVWFEAWRYQNETSPVIALLHHLREALRGFALLRDRAGHASAVVLESMLLALDSVVLKIEGETGFPIAKAKSSISFNPFQFRKASEEVAKSRLTTPLPSNQLRDALDNILATLLHKKKDEKQDEYDYPGPGERIVIFIDDLDRCSAEAMFSLLESIKIYLNLRHCVFVLGINRQELERGIASILPEPLAPNERHIRAHEYIEKLCGNTLRLPFPSKAAWGLMVKRWLKLDVGHKNNPLLEKVARLAVQYSALPENPRRIKMWCNSVLLMYEHRAQRLKKKLDSDLTSPPATEAAALVLMAALYTFYPELHQAMIACEDASFLMTLKEWCRAEKDFDLAIFACLRRVFAMPSLITQIKDDKKAALLTKMPEPASAELLRRFYSQATNDADDPGNPEPPRPKAIPLLVEPSSLQYFHPQKLVAEEELKEAHIKHYLHIDA